MSFDRAAVEEEVRHWFFDVYFNHWVEVGNGHRDEGPEFILKYWGRPMYATCDDPDISMWMKTDEEVIGFLTMQHDILKDSGFTHTVVPEQKVFAYNQNGAYVEGIWSRQRADNTEVHRIVVHFEVAKINGSWIVVGVQTRMTDKSRDNDTLEGAWHS
jgi:hypothetical protein